MDEGRVIPRTDSKASNDGGADKKGGRGSTVLKPRSSIVETEKVSLEDAYNKLPRRPLDEGGVAKVFKTFRKDDAKKENPYAVKQIPFGKMNDEQLQTEINMTKSLDHKYLVKCAAVIEDEKTQMHNLVLLYHNGKSVQKRLDYVYDLKDEGCFHCEVRLNECTVARTSYEMLIGLQYLHSNSIMHRDIQPSNYVFKYVGKRSAIVLCDFGCACYFTAPDTVIKTGVPANMLFCSPEMLKGTGYTEKTDVWSVGVTFYNMMLFFPAFGKGPPWGDDAETLKNAIFKGDLDDTFERHKGDWKMNDGDVEQHKAYFKKILNVDYTQRPTPEVLLAEEKWILAKKDIPLDEHDPLPCCSLL